MFEPKIPGLTLGSVIGGLNKTLSFANQIIPLYKEISPMVRNAKTAINLVKEFSNNTVSKTNEHLNNNLKPKINNVIDATYKEIKNSPTFFQ